MERQSIHGSRFRRFMEGKGFYAVLALCLLAVGGVAVATFGEKLFVREPEESSSRPEPTHAVEQIITNQPDERKTTTVPATTAVPTTAPAATAADLYVLPMGNALQRAYSDGKLVYSPTMADWRTHDGADFAGENGQTVKALADGTVKSVGEDPLWGGVIVLDHGSGVVSHLCGVTASVNVGARVKVGQKLGTLSTIPCESAQGYHLHLEMTADGEYVDPVAVIGADVRSAQ